MVWVNETRGSSVEVMPVCGGVEAGGVAVLPAPHSLEVGRVSSKIAGVILWTATHPRDQA